MIICRNCSQTFIDNKAGVTSVETCPRCDKEKEERGSGKWTKS
jgi:Zn finger protein HypA/HybF involved in hydrogenase expression